MKETTNYKLKKIELTDSPPDITVHSDNFDIIDTELKKNADAAAGAKDHANTELAKKVDKVTGKGLSTNDYTTAEKIKLSNIAAGAQVNTVTSVNSKTGAVTVTKSNVGLGNVDNLSAASIRSGTTKANVGLANVDNIKQATKTEHEALDTKVTSHLADYIHHAGYGTASGVNAKLIVLNPAPTSYKEGMTVAFKNATENTGTVTINVNGLGIKFILKSNGNPLTSGDLKASSIYTIRYNGTNFILQGEGGEYGTAQASDVLSPKTIGTENGIVTGTMVNRGAVANTITTQGGQYTISSGYHSGSGKVTASFTNLVARNIKSGVNIGGVVGNFSQSHSGSFPATGTPDLVISNLPSDLDLLVVYVAKLWDNGPSGILLHSKDNNKFPTEFNGTGLMSDSRILITSFINVAGTTCTIKFPANVETGSGTWYAFKI